MLAFRPSRPITCPLTPNCSAKSSSTTVRFCLLKPSSIQRRTKALFRSMTACGLSGGCSPQPAAITRTAAQSPAVAQPLTVFKRCPSFGNDSAAAHTVPL